MGGAKRRRLDRLRRRQRRAIEIISDPDVPYADAKRRLQEITAEIATIEQETKRGEVFEMPAKRAIEALAAKFRESEPKTFEGRRKLLEASGSPRATIPERAKPRSKTAFIYRAKRIVVAVFAPIPSASVSTAIAAKPGLRRSPRIP